MNDHHDALKHAADIGASITAGVTLLSQWAGILTPIVSLLVLLATLGWWAIRYIEWWKSGGTGGGE
ncbi:hypothetical protein UFOVP152_6 [uncultured Caudovirales phage]|uniref:Holin n=1 Tax=uncultured Caudovirales phage TaxID=2100421 RepID=A0A6J7W818_9CAUD|nr:hypothetical protein UFOVP152_6 [uncultured Caudovirales phage]